MSLTLDRLEEIKIVDSNGDELGIDASGYITANINGTVAISATDLDIRDLTHVSDSVKIGDGTETANVNASNELQVVDDGANTLLGTIDADTSALAGTVDGTELQVDIVAALPAGTNNIGDVDIASIAAGDNNIGNVDIVTMPGIYAEDSAHSSSDDGMFALAVRQDADAAFGADGDYGPLQLDSNGFLKVSGSFTAEEDSYDTLKASVETVGTSAVELATTPLSGRKNIIVQNLGSSDIYLAEDNTVTVAGATGGILVSKKSNLELKASAVMNLWAISANAGNDIRVLEMAG